MQQKKGEEISFQYSLPFFIFFAYIPFSIDMLFPQLHGRIRKLISILLILSTAVTTIFFGSRFAIMTPLLYGVIILFYSKIRIKNERLSR